MADTWMVDLRHFLAPTGALAPELPGPARRLAEYWVEIVAQGSNRDSPVTLRCRRRPARRPCDGVLNILLDANLDGLLWEIIHGWQGSFCILNREPP